MSGWAKLYMGWTPVSLSSVKRACMLALVPCILNDTGNEHAQLAWTRATL